MSFKEELKDNISEFERLNIQGSSQYSEQIKEEVGNSIMGMEEQGSSEESSSAVMSHKGVGWPEVPIKVDYEDTKTKFVLIIQN